MAWCLTKDQEAKFRQALLDKKIDPFKLADMTSEERRALFEKYVDPENAIQINSLYESKLLLKNQVTGFKTWAKRALGMKPQAKRDLLTKIERLDEIGVLEPKELQAFKEDLVRTRLGLNITFEEAKTINKLSEERVKARDKWQAKVNENISWNDDPHATRKEWINDEDRIRYGITQVGLENYVNDLKLEARKISFRESPVRATLDAVGTVPSIFKSLMASLDDSFFGRQGIKNLYGSVDQKKIWTRTFAKSFKDIGMELQAKRIEGLDAIDLVRADIYSRPNSLNGKYKAGGYRLDVLSEEAFPTSAPEKIPGLGRLFKASEAAFNGGALTMRADLADMHISRMEKQGINALNPEEARGVGHMVGSLTGRGSLGKLEPVGREINVLLFSGRFFKANFDTLTAHQFDPKATRYVKSEARKNLLSITAHIAGILFVAKMLDPDSVDEDPRSTHFGQIKIFGKWIEITGGMRTLVTLASRLVPTSRNGEWGFWMKSSTGKWTNLTAGKFGQQDATDILMDALLFNRLSPIARILADAWRGEMFGGEPFDIKKSIIQSVTPLSIQEVSQAKEDGFAPALAVAISEFLGFSVGGYKYKDNWNKKTSQEMINFKDQVGQEKFDQANDAYNRAYNIWLQEVEEDPKYKNLSDEGKDSLKGDARSAIKDKILKEYGYKKKTEKKNKEEKQEEKIRKKLLPKEIKKVSRLIKDTNNIFGQIKLIPEVLAAEDGRQVRKIFVKGDNVYTAYDDGTWEIRSLESYQKNGALAGLGKIFNDIGTKLGLPELNISEGLKYKNREQVIDELTKYKENVLDKISEEDQAKEEEEITIPEELTNQSNNAYYLKQDSKQITVKGGSEDEIIRTRVPQEISEAIYDVFGPELALEAAQVLHHPFGEQIRGEGNGENTRFQVKDIDRSNEGFDTPLKQKEYVGDVKGEDGKWHSVDRGLFRINSRRFQDIMFGKEEGYREAMYQAGILDDPFEDGVIKKSDVQEAWDKMNDLEYNLKMAKIIYELNGWDGWFAAPVGFASK